MPLYGPAWPLKTGNHDTYVVYEDLKQQISFYLKNLILTSPGENISDPGYGVGLRRFLFEQNTEFNRSTIKNAIASQIAAYLPYLSIDDIIVDASADEIDQNSLSIKIIYRISTDSISTTFELDSSNSSI